MWQRFYFNDEDVMAEAWSEELKLPLIKIPVRTNTLEEIRENPEYDNIQETV